MLLQATRAGQRQLRSAALHHARAVLLPTAAGASCLPARPVTAACAGCVDAAPSRRLTTSTHALSAGAASSSSADASNVPGGVSSLPPDLASLARGMLSGDRLALSRAITVIESTHPRHIRHAQQLLAALAVERQHREAQQKAAAAAGSPAADAPAATAEPLSKEAREEAALRAPRSLRIGISGPPGVGKSTFIEALGRFLLSQGHRLAVLSIDPSSHVSGGSILGDKTRMAELARHPQAYVRPSPSKCVLGGVAAATYDTLLLCEHAGFSLVIVETVGVGQSEVSVHAMVDLMVLLAQPGGGDELQGMKKGLVELIDLVVVNKADGDMLAAARHTKLDYVHALQLNTRRKKDTDWKPQVKLCSSINQIQGQSVHPSPHDQTAEEAAELASQASAAGASGSSSAAAGPAASASRQQSQLRDIWSPCARSTSGRGDPSATCTCAARSRQIPCSGRRSATTWPRGYSTAWARWTASDPCSSSCTRRRSSSSTRTRPLHHPPRRRCPLQK